LAQYRPTIFAYYILGVFRAFIYAPLFVGYLVGDLSFALLMIAWGLLKTGF